MKKFVKNPSKKRMSALLASTLVLSSFIPTMGNGINAQIDEVSDSLIDYVSNSSVTTGGSLVVEEEMPVIEPTEEVAEEIVSDVKNNGTYSITIGEVTLNVSDKTSMDLSQGKVYYAAENEAYISIDLKGETLSTGVLQNNSPEVISSLEVNGEGNVKIDFVDASTYIIKVQDTSKFQTPSVTDVYECTYATETGLTNLTKSQKIQDCFTTNNGIFTIGKGTGTAEPYWHDASHGLAINNGNYIDVVVAGNATITFSLCQYSSGNLMVSNLSKEGTGSFDSNEIKGKACNETITYTYTGEATTLRFTLEGSGESYFHGTTVKNAGDLKASQVVKEQLNMPKEMDAADSLTVTPVGHRLIFGHENSSASITNLKNVGYYVFDASQEVYTLEADIKLSAIGSGSSQGLFVGLFDDKDSISKIATVGIRGDGKIRNMYHKTGATSVSAGSIDKVYNKDHKIHVKVMKTSEGWYSEISTLDDSGNATIKYGSTELLADSSTNVRYGFAFSNVNGIITNLMLTDEAGDVIYSQNECYEAIGKAPAVEEIAAPILSEDRTSITVNWKGENCEEDGAYQIELSKDGGKTYTTLSDQVTEKTYTVAVDGSGQYVFRLRGVCGKLESAFMVSSSVEILAPLESPVLSAESGDAMISLKWEAIETATTYEVYRRGAEESTYSLIATVSDLAYTDTKVTNEEPYYYYVIAKSEINHSNASEALLMVPSAGREGQYVYESEATQLFVTKKSYDTVYKNEATLEGLVDRKGQLALEVNGRVQEEIALDKKGTFALKAKDLKQGRNDVNLLFTDGSGKVTRQSFNFVYLTNYDLVVDSQFTGVEGEKDENGVAMYRSVQAAVDSVPSNNTERVTILVKAGNYTEYLRVKTPYITLIGEDREKVNINYYDAVKTPAGGDTSVRCAIYVQSTATGFAAENLTFENTYTYLGDGTISNESADALRVDADAATFVNVKLLGYQDTLQANTNHQYFYKCYIAGNIDYIYGNSQALFNDCDLVYRYNGNKNSGYITAPKTDAKAEYGYIFNNCRILAEEGCSGNKYLLARPWGQDASVTFINTYMSSLVNKETSYADMSGNLYKAARFSEYYSYGGGYAINSNRPQISKAQAENMLKTSFLQWDPYATSEEIANQLVGSIVTNTEEQFVENEYIEQNADINATDDTGLGAYTIEGYAQNVTGGGALLENATNYYQVANANEFLSALATIKKNGKASVIELTQDIELGSIEIGEALTKYSTVIKAVNNAPLLHPTLLKTGVSSLMLKEMRNLTIYSKNGSALEHVCLDINNSSNIIIRNVVFDEIWEWDEATHGDYDRNDWDYVTIQNGSTDIWIDHCTFYKAYDGVVDVKKASSNAKTNVTISWCKFLPESETTFFDEMMNVLEANPEQYPYYNSLLTEHAMTKAQIRAYAAAQKKTHLIGASDTEDNIQNLQLTLANNYYKNSMDRMPRMRGGNAHVYNCILDAAEVYALKNSLTDDYARNKVVSNGAISTCNASVLLENTYIDSIINALASGNGDSAGGWINAINSIYYMGEVLTELNVTDNAGSGMILDADQFIASLPYSQYQLYPANQLLTKVMPNAGAGTLEMSSVQWQKTTYNEAVSEAPEEVCMVQLNYEGATENNEVESIKVVVGGFYGELPVPVKEGYKFLGWYTEAGEKVTTKTVVTQSTAHTLYAKWQENVSDEVTVTVNFDYQATGFEDTEKEVVVGEAYGTLPVPVREGYEFLGWYTAAGEKVTTNTSVTETAAHTLYAKWQENVTDEVKVKVNFDYQGTGFNHTVKEKEVVVGATYGELPTPVRNGYKFLGWYTAAGEKVTAATLVTNETVHVLYAHWQVELNDNDDDDTEVSTGNSSNSSQNKAESVTENNQGSQEPTVSVDKTSELPEFKDLSSHWAKDAITSMVQRGILKGMSEQNFEPNAAMTRAMFTTVLYRLAGEEKLVGTSSFKDVKSGSWYEEAVVWANEQGIVNGVSANKFNPNAPITREQMANMLYKYIQIMNLELDQTSEVTDFKDESQISAWAKDAMTYMAQTGLMLGDANQKANAKAQATRAEVSTMLDRFIQKLEQ